MMEPTSDLVDRPSMPTTDGGDLTHDATSGDSAPTRASAASLLEGGTGDVVLAQRYQLLGVLGRGASAVVYEALDLARAAQRVALKLLVAQQPHALLRLKEEFRGLSRVVHPNLVRLHGLGADAHGWFVVMEVVSGGRDFFSYVRPGGVLDEARLRAALAGLLRGVAALHAAGKAHRDLKPSNVLVDREGRVVIVDFGLNCEVSAGALPEGHFVGTPGYAPPEQLRGATIGPAADLYAVGVMLHQVLTGTLPHETDAQTSVQTHDDSAPLTALGVALRAPDPAQRPSVRDCLRALGESTLDLAEPRVSRFVGRTSLVHELLESARAARHEGLRLTVLRGSSGVGKTALLAHLAERLRSEPETVVLGGRCHPLEQVPYKAVDSLVDALVGYLTGLSSVDAAVLMPRDVSLLALLFPTLQRVPVVRHMPAQRVSADAPARTRTRAFAALKELLSRIADRHVLAICLDDLQWSDDDSSALLRELLREPDAPACFFLCTCRSDHALPSAVDEALDSFPAGRGREHTLAPLAESEATTLARALVGEEGTEDQLRMLVSDAAGSPFLLEALALGARTTGVAHDLRTLIGARVEALSSIERTILEVVCLAGQPLALTLCLRAAQADPAALSPLLGAALLRTTWEDGRECLESYHDRVRKEVTCALSPERRAFLHGRLASLLAEAEASDPALVAQHFHGAGRDVQAAPYWLRAAEQAALALAFGRAASLYTRALPHASSHAERQRIVLALAHTYAAHGQVDQAAVHYERGLATHGDASTQRELLSKAMMMHFLAGHSDQGARLLTQLCRELGVRPPPRREWLVTLVVLLLFVRYLVGGRLGRRALPLADRHRGTSRQALSVCMHAARGLSVVSLRHSEYFVVLAMLSVRRHRDRTHWPVAIAWEVLRRSSLRGATSRRDEQDMARALMLVKQAGDPENLSLVWGAEGGRCYAIGALRRSIEAFDRAEQVLQQEGRSVTPVLHGTRTGRCAAWLVRGTLHAVASHGKVWQSEAKAHGDPITELCLEVMSSYLLLARGDARGMREVAGQLDTPNGRRTLLTADPWWRGEPALHEQHAGDALAAYENASRSPAFSTVERTPFHRVWTSLYLGRAAMLAARQGDRARWLPVLRRAAARAARERYLGGAAIAAHLRAGLCLLDNQPERALSELSIAAVRYEALGMDAQAATMHYFTGDLRGGDGGAATKNKAIADMHALGIPSAERWFYAGLPAVRR